jgi:hypothetical protein
MSKPPFFESLQDTAETIAQERREEGCFIITKHHKNGYSFGTWGIDGEEIRHGLNLAIYYSFIFEEMEHRGQKY